MKPIEELAKELTGNWRKFDSFVWFREPDDPDNWFIWNLECRDSSLREQSNADAIRKEMEQYRLDAVPEEHSHWAVGWVRCLSIRVWDEKNTPTPAFTKAVELASFLEEYCVLDEEDLSRRELEETTRIVEREFSHFANKHDVELPEDWLSEVMQDNRIEIGEEFFPSDELISTILIEKGWWDGD